MSKKLSSLAQAVLLLVHHKKIHVRPAQKPQHFLLVAHGQPVMNLRAPVLELLFSQNYLLQKGDALCLTTKGEIFIAQRLSITPHTPELAQGVNASESPLAWLYHHKDRAGRRLIDEMQFSAGERLRADFTRAQLMQRTTTNWDMSLTRNHAGSSADLHFSEATLAAKHRYHKAMEAVGPELSGVLADICCFLKGLEAVEQERRWPPRTAKVILALALDRLAAHYGLSREAKGPPRSKMQHWAAADYKPEFQL